MREIIHTACAGLPGASLDHPFGPGVEVWKVGGKMFALISDQGVSLKAADRDSAAFLIEIGVARPAPYLKRGGWMLIPWENLEAEVVTGADMAARLATSHAAVCAGLPKRLRPEAAAQPGV